MHLGGILLFLVVHQIHTEYVSNHLIGLANMMLFFRLLIFNRGCD